MDNCRTVVEEIVVGEGELVESVYHTRQETKFFPQVIQGEDEDIDDLEQEELAVPGSLPAKSHVGHDHMKMEEERFHNNPYHYPMS